MRESWEILWWASKIRVVSWNEKNKYVFFSLQESDAKTHLRYPVLSWHNKTSSSSHILSFLCVSRLYFHLFGLVLLCISWRNKALGIHLHGLYVGRCLARRRRKTLHLQERLDVLHLGAVRAVGHRLSFRGQNTGSFPFGILRFLFSGDKKQINAYASIRTFMKLLIII